MAYLALYRKYRPTTFDGLIGQEHVVKTLVNQIESGRIGHAYLFTGTRGTGKTSAAKIFAKAINCLNPVNGSPCGKCESCLALSDPSNIDVAEIDAASNNGVNEIRELREKVQYPPVSCRYKVYIIDEVHMLTGAAFNALLKTLEEPPKHAVFILATTEAQKIPATILSRCMRFDFRLISTERIAKLVSDIFDEQGKEYEDEAVFAIAKAGEGSIRDALSVADIALSYGNGKLTYNDVLEILGSSDADALYDFTESILRSDAGSVLGTIDRLCSLGKSMGVLIKDVTQTIRDLLIAKTCDNANSILKLPTNQFEKIRETAKNYGEERFIRILEIFSDAENSLKYTNHPRVVFETAAIKASRPDADYDIGALLSRIKALEDGSIPQAAAKPNVAEVAPIKERREERPAPAPITAPAAEAEKPAKKSPVEAGAEEVKGRMLTNLRKQNSEMLWNVMQDVKVETDSSGITLTVKSEEDKELLENPINRKHLKDALEEYSASEPKIKVAESEKAKDEVDKAVERIKNIFGDDIVIIK